jgi:hypothetical protein
VDVERRCLGLAVLKNVQPPPLFGLARLCQGPVRERRRSHTLQSRILPSNSLAVSNLTILQSLQFRILLS